MALFWRVWAAASLGNVFVMGVLVALAALQFTSINAALVGERLAVLAGRTVAPFAASARLGLPLSSVRNATAILPLMLALVAATVLAVGSYVLNAFDRAVAPELAKRTRLIGFTVRAELRRALELGGRLDAIGGLDRYLSDTLGKFAPWRCLPR